MDRSTPLYAVSRCLSQNELLQATAFPLRRILDRKAEACSQRHESAGRRSPFPDRPGHSDADDQDPRVRVFEGELTHPVSHVDTEPLHRLRCSAEVVPAERLNDEVDVSPGQEARLEGE